MNNESGEFAMLLDEAKAERERDDAILRANLVRAYRWAFRLDESEDVEKIADEFRQLAGPSIRADVWNYLNRSGYSVSNITAYPHHPITVLHAYRMAQLAGVQTTAIPKVRRALTFARSVIMGKLDVHSPEYYGEITGFFKTAPTAFVPHHGTDHAATATYAN